MAPSHTGYGIPVTQVMALPGAEPGQGKEDTRPHTLLHTASSLTGCSRVCAGREVGSQAAMAHPGLGGKVPTGRGRYLGQHPVDEGREGGRGKTRGEDMVEEEAGQTEGGIFSQRSWGLQARANGK